MNQPTPTMIGMHVKDLTYEQLNHFSRQLAAIEHGTGVILAVANTPEELGKELLGRSNWFRISITTESEMNEIFFDALKR